MQPARAGKAGFQRGIEHASGLQEKGFGMFRCEILQERFWRDACPSRKKAVEMKLTEPGHFRERSQIGLLAIMFVQVADDLFDFLIIGHESV
jgi:hypothetical protein